MCDGISESSQPSRGFLASFSVQSESTGSDLLVFPCWSIFSRGPKRLTFYKQVLWATEVFRDPCANHSMSSASSSVAPSSIFEGAFGGTGCLLQVEKTWLAFLPG